jgi:hypothetical protein
MTYGMTELGWKMLRDFHKTGEVGYRNARGDIDRQAIVERDNADVPTGLQCHPCRVRSQSEVAVVENSRENVQATVT